MNIKKIIVIMFLIFCLSGCSVNYELKIEENTIDEKISVSERESVIHSIIVDMPTTEGNPEFYIKYIESNISLNVFQGYEEINTFDFNTNKDIELKNNTYYSNYTRNNIIIEQVYLNKFFKDYYVENKDNRIKIVANNVNTEYLQEVYNYKFSIVTPFVAIKNNATSISNKNDVSTYSWEYTKDTIEKAHIDIELDLTYDNVEKSKKDNFLIIGSIIGGCILIILFIFLFFKSKEKKVNKI